VHAAEPLEAVDDSPAREALPSEQTIGREEEAILWRSLGKIPELYREPLILFYREHQSIESVAAELGLSEDAVKQRLSRGRKLLQEEVQAFVENTLRRTAPGQAFSNAVLAALPLTAGSAATAGVGAAAKGTAAAKSGFLGAWLGPLIGIVGGITAHWLVVRAAPTAREYRLKKFVFTGFWIFVLGWCVAGQLAMRALSRRLGWSDGTFFTVMSGFWWFYAVVVATLCIVMFRRILSIREQSEATAEIPRPAMIPLKPGARIVLVVGLYLACFWWLIDLAWRAHDPIWAGIITGLMVLLGAGNYFQRLARTGSAIIRETARQLALVWGVILVILNLRFDAWEASLHGMDLAAMHRLLPVWVIPVLTLTLVVWIGILLAVTKPKRSPLTF
jgi:hypothetical protein